MEKLKGTKEIVERLDSLLRKELGSGLIDLDQIKPDKFDLVFNFLDKWWSELSEDEKLTFALNASVDILGPLPKIMESCCGRGQRCPEA
jgi:hypothetical protein